MEKMADYTPNWKADPTARAALGNASGFRTVQIMSDREIEKHRKKTQTWNIRREEERRKEEKQDAPSERRASLACKRNYQNGDQAPRV